ncbi:MAG: hypothetical protein ABL958_00465 [Bdellovibrionia bacterium]
MIRFLIFLIILLPPLAIGLVFVVLRVIVGLLTGKARFQTVVISPKFERHRDGHPIRDVTPTRGKSAPPAILDV